MRTVHKNPKWNVFILCIYVRHTDDGWGVFNKFIVHAICEYYYKRRPRGTIIKRAFLKKLIIGSSIWLLTWHETITRIGLGTLNVYWRNSINAHKSPEFRLN